MPDDPTHPTPSRSLPTDHSGPSRSRPSQLTYQVSPLRSIPSQADVPPRAMPPPDDSPHRTAPPRPTFQAIPHLAMPTGHSRPPPPGPRRQSVPHLSGSLHSWPCRLVTPSCPDPSRADNTSRTAPVLADWPPRFLSPRSRLCRLTIPPQPGPSHADWPSLPIPGPADMPPPTPVAPAPPLPTRLPLCCAL